MAAHARRSLAGALDVFPEEGMCLKRTIGARVERFSSDNQGDGDGLARPSRARADGLVRRPVGQPSVLNERRGIGDREQAPFVAGGSFMGALDGTRGAGPVETNGDFLAGVERAAVT